MANLAKLAVVLVLGVALQGAYADEPEAIVGGEYAAKGEFPYQVSLRLNGHHFCGGSIISPNHILTAAHCAYGTLKAPYYDASVVSGTIDLKSGGKTHTIKKVIVHPQYRHEMSVSWINDVAVIVLTNPIVEDEYTKVVHLTNVRPTANTPAVVSGWGMTKANGVASDRLKKVTVYAMDTASCQARHRQPIYPTHLCTTSRPGQGACQGDSGGPLVAHGVQVGIVSWVLPCAIGAPDVYTSVADHIPFINQCTLHT